MQDKTNSNLPQEKNKIEDNESDNLEDIIEQFKELNKKLEEPLNSEILYHDQEKTKRKYEGEIKDGKYDGRGILYDFSGKIEYNGYFKDNKYDGYGREYNFYDNKLKYEGFFSNYKYNGKGILYYKNNKIFFCGIFKDDEFVKGILFDPEGKITYKGDIINKNPKEGKNIKLYEINGNLIYEGDFLDGKYHGHGTLYEAVKFERKGITTEFKGIKYVGEFNKGKYGGFGKLYIDHNLGKYLYYEGQFNDGIFNGEGILYYQNGKKYYDGKFKNGEICGKGTKFYKNGSKKIEGIFENKNSCEGKYYNPENKELYEGKMVNEIPNEGKNIIIYNDNMNKVYEGEISNGAYEGEGIEYSPLIKNMILYKGKFSKNYYSAPEDECQSKSNPINISVYYKENELDAKNLINRFLGKEIKTTVEDKGNEFSFKYEYNKIYYNINFIQNDAINQIKNSDIIFYLFDLNNENQIKESELNEIKKANKKDALIYLIGNYLELIEKEDITKECLEEYRSQAIKLISEKKINKYFEISIENGNGFYNLKKNTEIDSALYNESKDTNENKGYGLLSYFSYCQII